MTTKRVMNLNGGDIFEHQGKLVAVFGVRGTTEVVEVCGERAVMRDGEFFRASPVEGVRVSLGQEVRVSMRHVQYPRTGEG